jgi:hypothetical protein
MLSNWPSTLAHQDFQARHADMLAAARAGEIVDPNKPSTLTVEDFIRSTEIAWAALLVRGVSINYVENDAEASKSEGI